MPTIRLTDSRAKYGNRKTEVDGHSFDSVKEANRYRELCLLLRAGQIHTLELQPRYDMVINDVKCGFYKADFRYWDGKAKKQVIEDVKSEGTRTTVYKLKKRIVEALYGIVITET